MALCFISMHMKFEFKVTFTVPPQTHLKVHQLWYQADFSGWMGASNYNFVKWQYRTSKVTGCYTHFALLYLRGGLCWDWGLACRRSIAIFTSENKINPNVEHNSDKLISLCVHAEWGRHENTSTIPMKISSDIQSLKLQNGRDSKCSELGLPNLSN